MAVGRRALAVIVAFAVALVTGSTSALASTGQAAGEPAPTRLHPLPATRAGVGGLAWHGPGAELGEYAASITAGAIGIADQPRLAVSGQADTVRIGKYATSAPAAMAVYTGPSTGQLKEVFQARKVDPALDVAVGPGGKPVVAYASAGRLHLLVGGRDVDTRYPAYGAAMALSKSGAVAHLAWSVKPTAAPCSTS